MKKLSHIMMLLAGVIVLMHSMVPHEHHDELSQSEHIQQHNTASSLLDFIALAFHVDQGEGHLEKYEAASGQHFIFDAVLLEEMVLELVPVLLKEAETPGSTEPNCFYQSVYTPQLRFRGPPAMA